MHVDTELCSNGSTGAPRLYLGDPDEDFELVDVELLIHAFGEPGPQQVHGGSVPLLKHINTTPSSKTHIHTQTGDIMTCS